MSLRGLFSPNRLNNMLVGLFESTESVDLEPTDKTPGWRSSNSQKHKSICSICSYQSFSWCGVWNVSARLFLPSITSTFLCLYTNLSIFGKTWIYLHVLTWAFFAGVKAKENIGMWIKVNFRSGLQGVDIHKEINRKISVNKNGGMTCNSVCLCLISLFLHGPLCAYSLCFPSSIDSQSFLDKFLGFHP